MRIGGHPGMNGVSLFAGTKRGLPLPAGALVRCVDVSRTREAQAPIPEDLELANGFWVAPTLFTDVTRDMRIATEERYDRNVFQPTATTVQRWS